MSEHKCGVCGASNMTHDTRNLTYEYKGDRLIVPAMKGWFCHSCGDAELDDGFGEAYFAQIQEFTLNRDAEEGRWLSDVMKRLKMSNLEAVAIAGGGKNAFAKYRAGTKPVAAVKTLFTLLDRHPELMTEVMGFDHVKAGLPKTAKYGIAHIRRAAAAAKKSEPGKSVRLRKATAGKAA